MSKEVNNINGGGKVKNNKIILNVLTYDKKGKRTKEKDFSLDFVNTGVNTKDITKRFNRYMKQEYNKIFDEYFIPTVIRNTFITSTTVPPYKELPKNTILAFKRPSDNKTSVSFDYGDYNYTKEGNEFKVKYIGDKKEITKFPFGGLSEYKVNFYECYKETKITNFDFNNLMLDMCVSMERMFYKCKNLVKVSNIAPHLYKIPLKDMSEMFAYCYSLSDVDIGDLNQTFNIYQLQRMFYACLSLKKLDISGIKLKGRYGEDVDESSMFSHCYNLREITCTKDQLIEIKTSLPNYMLWIDERIYDKYNSKEMDKQKGSPSKKTRKIKFINTFYKNKLLISDLDKDRNNLLLVKNVVNT